MRACLHPCIEDEGLPGHRSLQQSSQKRLPQSPSVSKARTTHILEAGTPQPAFSNLGPGATSSPVARGGTFPLLPQAAYSPYAHALYPCIKPVPSLPALFSSTLVPRQPLSLPTKVITWCDSVASIGPLIAAKTLTPTILGDPQKPTV